ncbi:MAG: magnesium/cobalt transporter CorA [Gemmatimonadota bacterium]|nr:magnesium/cobalt transporter CorA [Gemmatimonadota bacterium]MDH5804459.1 magnesium/cobalt transporter CorA [Gemmatimonadota bacterium]
MGSKSKRRPGHGKILTPRFRKQGQPPGTVETHPDALPTTVRTIGYSPDSVNETVVGNLSEIGNMREGVKVLWVNIDGLRDKDAFSKLGAAFGLHPLALEDVVNVHQRPKAEDYDSHAFVVIRMPNWKDGLILEQLSIFFGKNFVVTIQEAPGDCLDSLRNRIRTGRGKVRTEGADYLAYAVIDTVIDQYGPIVERYSSKLEILESRILNKTDFDSVTEVHSIRHDLHALRTILVHTRDALTLLARDEAGIISETTEVFLRDCLDHSTQLLDGVDACRSLSSDLLALYASMTSYRMNEIMKVLTVIATIFIPLSFITGIYGMNFDPSMSAWNMPELGWKFGYPFALGIMAATAVGLLMFFKRRGWIMSGVVDGKTNENSKEPADHDNA